MKALADASFLIALVNTREIAHLACVDIARRWSNNIIIPATSIPEAAHLLLVRRGHRIMRAFVEQLSHPAWEIESFDGQDLPRITKLLSQYQDAKLDFNDCAIVALAERLRINTILTLDQRDFHMIRPKHTPYFTILPH